MCHIDPSSGFVAGLRFYAVIKGLNFLCKFQGFSSLNPHQPLQVQGLLFGNRQIVFGVLEAFVSQQNLTGPYIPTRLLIDQGRNCLPD